MRFLLLAGIEWSDRNQAAVLTMAATVTIAGAALIHYFF